MTALRQEAMQILNNVPENVLAEIVTYLRNFQTETPVQDEPETEIAPEDDDPITEEEFQAFLHSNGGIDPKKAAAFERLEKWKKDNAEFLNSEIDDDKKFEEAEIEPETEIRRQPRKLTEEEFQKLLNSFGGIDPKKAAAFERLEKWKKDNAEFLNSGIDWDKELEEALNEKYGIIG